MVERRILQNEPIVPQKMGSRVALTTFICRAVHLVLTKNFCQFGNKFYRQFLGFATGVSSGASLAHIFLYELTRTTFTQKSLRRNRSITSFFRCVTKRGYITALF
eukprot:COSAG01_NODE_697_length_14188_cov_41.810348_7_plen_105_part_00